MNISEFAARHPELDKVQLQQLGLLALNMQAVNCLNLGPNSSIGDHPFAQELMHNKGDQTYLVHGTYNAVTAEGIAANGLRFRSSPTGPDLRTVSYMLTAPHDPMPQGPTNRLLLDYRHHGHEVSTTIKPVKVVFAFPFARAAQPAYNNPPNNRWLPPELNSVGTYVQQYGPADVEGEVLYGIDPQFMHGYLTKNIRSMYQIHDLAAAVG